MEEIRSEVTAGGFLVDLEEADCHVVGRAIG